jgi:hypothetical protein
MNNCRSKMIKVKVEKAYFAALVRRCEWDTGIVFYSNRRKS